MSPTAPGTGASAVSTAGAVPVTAAVPARRPSTWRRFREQPAAVLALALFAVVALVALGAPWLYPGSPWRMVGRPLIEPLSQARFPLGTDMLGRDIAAGLVHGARASLLVGLASTGLALLIGVPLGALAGYAGRRVDVALSTLIECFQTIPQFAMAVVLVAIVGPSVSTIVVAISVVSWPPVARLVRAEILSLRERDFVIAARVAGESGWRILLAHVLPNAAAPIIVCASFMVATAMLTEAALAFLGLGDARLMSWGFMLGAARTMVRETWWMSLWPGLALMLTVLSINVAAEGLQHALQPAGGQRGGTAESLE
ncbi:ABC transporter permease [Xylophilus sp.]|uniref:ABC transporter permease n=1 Tax=Xylophilus sp. TaxID=2653893 RepID=UPI0013BA795E|nr:ABC transporter permease [Xylophilus sp.]KAF1044542.1 MAG: Dipeptide transport system permease protein DppC [Xylophilus sp.]